MTTAHDIPPPRTVGISGLGSIGMQHARAVGGLDGVEVIGFDADPDRRAEVRGGGIAVADSLDELLASRPVAVVLAGPDHTHIPQLLDAIRASVPALVEKPVAVNTAEAIAALAEVRASGVPVVVGYVLRHRALLRAVADLVADGAIGTVTSAQVMLGARDTITRARSRFRDPAPGRLYRDYSHEWDYLAWWFGPVQRVFAHARTVFHAGHDEQPNVVDVLVEHEAVVAACHLDYLEPVGLRTMHLIGTGGSAFADVRNGTLDVRTEAGTDHRDLAETAADVLTAQAAHLLDVAAGGDPAADLADGIAALAVAEAAQASATTQRWVAPDRATSRGGATA